MDFFDQFMDFFENEVSRHVEDIVKDLGPDEIHQLYIGPSRG